MEGLNDRQRRFARLVVSGVPAGRAYERAGYNSTGAVADTCASELLRNPKVEEYIEKLRNRAENAEVLTLEQALEWLSRAITTPVGEIDEESDLAQEVTFETVGGSARGRLKRGHAESGNEVQNSSIEVAKIKSVSKIEALKQLSVMMGWNKAQKVELSAADSLREALTGLTPSTLPSDKM